MRAFHDDPAIKQMLLARCVTSRDTNRYRQGGCHNEHDMQASCATALMLQTKHPRLIEFEDLFGLSYAFARHAEMLFEALPYEGATVFPEYAIAAIAVGADTRPIGWQLLHRTLAEHEGAQHRIVAATIDDTLAFLAPLTAGGTVDIIDARAKMMKAGKTLSVAYEAVGHQEHPVWDVALIAKKALEAAATTDVAEAGNEVMRAVKITTRTPEGAIASARRMISLLTAIEPAHSHQRQLPSVDIGNRRDEQAASAVKRPADLLAIDNECDPKVRRRSRRPLKKGQPSAEPA